MNGKTVLLAVSVVLASGCDPDTEGSDAELRDGEAPLNSGVESCSAYWPIRAMHSNVTMAKNDSGVQMLALSEVRPLGTAHDVYSRHVFRLDGDLSLVDDATGEVVSLGQQPVRRNADIPSGGLFFYSQFDNTPGESRLSGALTARFGAKPVDYDWKYCSIQLYPKKFFPGTDDLLWQHDGGQVRYSRMHQGDFRADVEIDDPVSSNAWTLRGAGDVDGDGTEDVIWQSAGGQVHYWRMLLGERRAGIDIDQPVTGDHWSLRAVGDVDGDGTDDIVWRDRTGLVHYWKMSNGERQEGIDIGRTSGLPATLIAAGDVDGDGVDDLVWQDIDGQAYYWRMSGGQRVATHDIAEAVPEGMASLRGVGDVDGDGTEDLVWEGYGGDVFAWLLEGGERIATLPIEMPSRDPGWRLVGVGDVF